VQGMRAFTQWRKPEWPTAQRIYQVKLRGKILFSHAMDKLGLWGAARCRVDAQERGVLERREFGPDRTRLRPGEGRGRMHQAMARGLKKAARMLMSNMAAYSLVGSRSLAAVRPS
jgi:hypothetical protein